MSDLARPNGPGSCPNGLSPSVSGHSACDPSRTPWQPIATAPKGRDEAGVLQQVLLIGRYPSNGHHTDIVQGWWCEVGFAQIESYWERWRHAFPPTHWMPVPAPPPAQAMEAGTVETEGLGAKPDSAVNEVDAPEPSLSTEAKETAA